VKSNAVFFLSFNHHIFVDFLFECRSRTKGGGREDTRYQGRHQGQGATNQAATAAGRATADNGETMGEGRLMHTAAKACRGVVTCMPRVASRGGRIPQLNTCRTIDRTTPQVAQERTPRIPLTTLTLLNRPTCPRPGRRCCLICTTHTRMQLLGKKSSQRVPSRCIRIHTTTTTTTHTHG
jgi:hypothetical protein